ncbi:hypothetical protein CWE09_03750 [Aliidiomarina minuta]|uniref:Uncharacterized protein n=1 Tax=Aliidiomarina minuta TaxID=880057 RepID=A0A432W6Z6_9GAMM|nr:hypothetical protein [Aliidiomarina minuta]RUO25854.1 hypothetical protein CWE09_03750 [Aliidiomarina minuta]
MISKILTISLPVSLFTLAMHSAQAEIHDPTTLQDLESQCNQSVSGAQTCQRLQNYAHLLGISDLRRYHHFVSVIHQALNEGKPIVEGKPIYKTQVYMDAFSYFDRGEAIPAKLEQRLEAKLKSRQKKLADALWLQPHEVDAVIDNYFRLVEFKGAEQQLAETQVVILSDGDDRSEVDEVITVTRPRALNWGSGGAALSTGATQAIHEAGIYHGGPNYIQIQIRIEIEDSVESEYRTFNYREWSGANPIEGSWQTCERCPIEIPID